MTFFVGICRGRKSGSSASKIRFPEFGPKFGFRRCKILVTQHCDPPNALYGIAIPIASMFSRYRRVSSYTPFWGVPQNYVEGGGGKGGGKGGGIASQCCPLPIGRFGGDNSYTVANRG